MATTASSRPTSPAPATEAGPASPPGPAATPRTWWSGHPVALAAYVGALGLCGQAVAYSRGWAGESDPLVWWYLSHVVIVVPFALLLTARSITRAQRILGSLAFTLLLYASWVLSNPVMAARFDETLHVSTLRSLLAGEGWFEPNEMLPISPYYPGLELAAGAVHWLTGLPLMACQVLVVILSRVAFVLAFFLLAERVGRSARAGSIAVFLYAASSQFYFFNAQFSYQTVAIALAVGAMALLVASWSSERPRPLLLVAQACLAGLAMTHHLTSWLTITALWVIALLLRRHGESHRARLAMLTAAGATLSAALWTVFTASLLSRYLVPIFDKARGEVTSIVLRQGGERQLFADTGGNATPQWEVLIMFLSMLMWLVLLLPAGWSGLRAHTLGRSWSRLLVLGIAGIYPVLLVARFSPTASDIGERASTFVAMAMAVVIAAWLAGRALGPKPIVAVAGVVLVLGGTILGGGPDWQRVPGPYLAGAEQRSVDGTTVSFARWSARHLPEGSIIASDLTVNRVLPDFVDITPATRISGHLDVTPVFIYDDVTDETIESLRDNDVDFVIADTRIAGRSVLSGSFFEGSNDYGPTAMTINPLSIEKFETEPETFIKVLDGPIRVYDVRALRGEPRVFADRADPVLPGGHDLTRMLLFAGILGLIALAGLTRVVGLAGRWGWVHTAGVLAAIPGLMAVGAIGEVLGYQATAGAFALAILAFVALDRLLRRAPSRSAASVRALAPAALPVVAVSALLGVAIAVSTIAAWDALYAEPTQWPSPAGAPVQQGEAGEVP